MSSLHLKKQSLEVDRDSAFQNQLVVVDGQPGCGKTMLTAIISSLARVELMNYSTEVESICQLHSFQKISDDAAKMMVRMKLDEMIYETMMSRRVNFRFTDLSSVFSNPFPYRYFKRAFQKGDELVPERIKKEQPILNLATHDLLMGSKPLFDAFIDKITFIEVVRHPLYMLKQQALNMKRLFNMPRDFVTYYKYQNGHVPFFAHGYEAQYVEGNDFDKAIYRMLSINERTEAFKDQLTDEEKKQLITIPFECFVLNPDPYLKLIRERLGTVNTSVTSRVLEKNKVPRKELADGIDLPIYRRCGWQPPQQTGNEFLELESRRQYAVDQDVSSKALSLLDELSRAYQDKYLVEYEYLWKECGTA